MPRKLTAVFINRLKYSNINTNQTSLIFKCISPLLYSAIAVNLKACNHFRLYNGKAAEVRLCIFHTLPELGFTVRIPLLKSNA